MNSFTMTHVFILVAMWAAWMIPLSTILRRIGWSRGLVLVAIFPPFGMVLLWCIAFGQWKPND